MTLKAFGFVPYRGLTTRNQTRGPCVTAEICVSFLIPQQLATGSIIKYFVNMHPSGVVLCTTQPVHVLQRK